MQAALDWLASLPPELMYPLLGAVAAVENLVPPFPADVAVTFGAFVAAKGQHRMHFVFLSAWLGNVAGALFVYEVSRRYGADRLQRYVGASPGADARFRRMFERYGLSALFVARFVPGVRALVPAVAGALKLSRLATVLMLSSAAAIWYGLITLAAFRIQTDWERMQAGITDYTTAVGLAAGGLLAVGALTWFIAQRRQKRP